MADADRLFHTYHAPLVRYLTRRLGDRDWAEEVAQETFLRALKHGPIASERAWVFAVATNLVRDEGRKASRRRRNLQLLAEEARVHDAEEPVSAVERANEAGAAGGGGGGVAGGGGWSGWPRGIGWRCSCARKGWNTGRLPRRLGCRWGRWGRRWCGRVGGWPRHMMRSARRRRRERPRRGGEVCMERDGHTDVHVDEATVHAWLDGALAPGEAARVAAHVEGCAACAEMVAEARGLIAASSRILSALDHVPADVVPVRRRAVAWYQGWPVRVAASVVVAVVGGIVVAGRLHLVAPMARHETPVEAPAVSPAPTAVAPVAPAPPVAVGPVPKAQQPL